MSEISITVPAEYAERFKSEALDTLAMVAENLHEAAEWRKEGKGNPNRLGHTLPQMRAAEALFEQVERSNGGPLHVTGERRVIVDTLDGCALHVADDIEGAVGACGEENRARALIAELEEWLTMRDFHRGEDR